MSKLWGVAKFVFGPAPDPRPYADPNCPVCRGRGKWAGNGGFETCSCVRDTVRGLDTFPQPTGRRSVIEPLPPPTPGELRELTPGEQAQNELEGRVLASLTPDQRMARAEGKLSLCCGAKRCHCGVNHWADEREQVNDWQGPYDGPPQAPPPDHPAYPHWEAFRDEVYARPNLLRQERQRDYEALKVWTDGIRRRETGA